MFVNRPVRIRGLRRGLGTVATPVAGSIVLSSDPVSQRMPVGAPFYRRPVIGFRPLGPTFPVTPTRPPWSAGSSPYGSTPQNPTGSQLATAQALLQANPSLLNPTQWQMLQQAGLVSSTLPYSSASQVGSGNPAIVPDPSVAASSGTDIGTLLSTPYGGLPLYLWLGVGAGAYLLFSQKSGRR